MWAPVAKGFVAGSPAETEVPPIVIIERNFQERDYFPQASAAAGLLFGSLLGCSVEVRQVDLSCQ